MRSRQPRTIGTSFNVASLTEVEIKAVITSVAVSGDQLSAEFANCVVIEGGPLGLHQHLEGVFLLMEAALLVGEGVLHEETVLAWGSATFTYTG